jgi:hypothetical protein
MAAAVAVLMQRAAQAPAAVAVQEQLVHFVLVALLVLPQ